MTAVRLEWPVSDERLRGVRVPVDIRTSTLALLRGAEMPGAVELAPGTYVLTAKLPAGQELTRIVTVGDEAMKVAFAPEETPLREALDYLASAGERRAVLRAAAVAAGGLVLQAAQAPATGRVARRAAGWLASARSRLGEVAGRVLGRFGPPDASIGGTIAGPPPMPRRAQALPAPAAPPGRLRGFRADPLAGKAQEVDLAMELLDRSDDVVQYRLGPSPELRYVQSLQPGRRPVNIALPTSSRAGCRVVVRRLPERYWVEVQIEHRAGNLLLGYQRNAAPREEALTAERLLAEKFDDPIAAAIGAYSLLRFGDLDRLHGWPENLRRSFPSLPDGAVIHGEQLARQGEHEAALAAFLEASGRGLPLFSDGIDFLYKRLKLYTAAAGEFPAAEVARGERLLTLLHSLVGFIDFTQVVTTLTGIDPAHPDAEPLAGSPPDRGVDLAAAFAGPSSSARVKTAVLT